MKIIPNDPKTPEQLGFVPKFSVMIEAGNPENFWGCLAQYPPKKLGQIPAALAISGIFERFSTGPNGPEVGGPVRLFKVI